MATLEVAGARVPVTLRNLSQEGVLVEGDDLPLENQSTWFERNDLRMKGAVVWVQGRYAGVSFDEPLKREDVLRNIPPAKERSQPVCRRPSLACRPLTPYERKMMETWMTDANVSAFGD